MIEFVVAALMVIGVAFIALGTVGLVRLPNVYNRMHSTTKATTLGASSILVAAALHFGNGSSMTALITVLFLFLTAPTGAHLISRAAEKMGVEFLDQ